METVIIVVVVSAAFAISFAAGRSYGIRCRKAPPFRYWIANAIGMGLGFAVAVLAMTISQQWLWVAALGMMAGSVTGLKWGLGRVVGAGSAAGGLDAELDEDDDEE